MNSTDAIQLSIASGLVGAAITSGVFLTWNAVSAYRAACARVNHLRNSRTIRPSSGL